MLISKPADIDIRSYGEPERPDHHDFFQLVLPLSGDLLIDVGGTAGHLAPGSASFIEPGLLHSQAGTSPNRSLILDLDPAVLEDDVAERLATKQVIQLSPPTMRLIEYMELLLADKAPVVTNVQHWVPLLLDGLLHEVPRPKSRLTLLLHAMTARPELPWTTGQMAGKAALSISRLHELFQVELATTPRAWLAQLRLRKAMELLARTHLPLAEIAFRCGYADQSALTHAMRRAGEISPAAYRKNAHAQELATKSP